MWSVFQGPCCAECSLPLKQLGNKGEASWEDFFFSSVFLNSFRLRQQVSKQFLKHILQTLFTAKKTCYEARRQQLLLVAFNIHTLTGIFWTGKNIFTSPTNKVKSITNPKNIALPRVLGNTTNNCRNLCPVSLPVSVSVCLPACQCFCLSVSLSFDFLNSWWIWTLSLHMDLDLDLLYHQWHHRKCTWINRIVSI